MTDNRAPCVPQELIWRQLDDKAVVVSPHSGKVQVFNEVGTIIWQLLTEQATPTDIEQHLVTNYQITPEEASRDLQDFLAQLSERGLLVWQDKSTNR